MTIENQCEGTDRQMNQQELLSKSVQNLIDKRLQQRKSQEEIEGNITPEKIQQKVKEFENYQRHQSLYSLRTINEGGESNVEPTFILDNQNVSTRYNDKFDRSGYFSPDECRNEYNTAHVRLFSRIDLNTDRVNERVPEIDNNNSQTAKAQHI